MKRLLTILLICISLAVQAQYSATLPSGFTPFSTQMYYKISGGDTLFVQGATGKGFHYFTPSRTLLDSLFLKVDKIPGKGLSTEDYTTAEKSKLAGIEAGAEVNVNADWSAVSGDAMILNKPTFVSTESDPVFLGQKGAINGVATLNSSGKIPNAQIPALALVDTYVAASQAAMLALSTAEQGDVAIRTDLSKTFILTDNNYSTLASWKELLSPVIPAETDPIWGASPSAGITSTNIANWNTAFTYSQVGHLPLSGGTLTGPLNGTSAIFSGRVYTSNHFRSDNDANNYILYGFGSSLYGAVSTISSTEWALGYTNSPTTLLNYALKWNSSGATTFSSGVTIAPSSGQSSITLNRPSTSVSSYALFTTGSTQNWYLGTNALGTNLNDIYIYNYSTGSTALSFSYSTNAATFSYLSGGGDKLVSANSSGTLGGVAIGSGLSYSGGVLSATGGATGTVTGTGTAGYISKWNSASDIGNSIMSESGTTISVSGDLSATRLFSQGGSYGLVQSYNASGAAAMLRAFSGTSYFDIGVRHTNNGNLLLFGKDLEQTGSTGGSVYATLNTAGLFVAASFSGLGTGLTGTAAGLTVGNSNALGGYTAAFTAVANTVALRDGSGVISASSFSGAATGLTGTAASLTAGAANSVSWTNVSGRPTAVSSFTNDSGYITNSTSSLVNYYTATQIQNFFSGASAITGYNYSNWNTAYGWGNHASAGYAPLSSPSFSGSPTAPTPSAGDNSNKLATTAYFDTAIGKVLLRSITTFSGSGLGGLLDFNTGIQSGSLFLVIPGSQDAAGTGYYVAKVNNGLVDEWHIIFPNGAPSGSSNITFYYVVLQ